MAGDSGRNYPSRPLVGVGGVVLKDGAVLLIRRGKPPRQGEWSLPGGAQRLGETVAAAVTREVAEETGLSVTPHAVVAVVDMIDRDHDGAIRYHYTLIDMVAVWQGGEPRAGDDAVAVAWAPLADLAAFGLWEETVRVIHAAAALPSSSLPAAADGPVQRSWNPLRIET